MDKKRIALAIYGLIAFTVVSFTAVWFFKYMKKWARIKQQRTLIAETKKEIAYYTQRGFDNTTELIALLQGRMQRAQEKIAQLQNEWFLVPDTSCTVEKKTFLKKLIALNKKMLLTSMNDINQYRTNRSDDAQAIISFSYDKVIRLTLALNELEKQCTHADGLSDAGEFRDRLERMKEINIQSIAQFKKLIEQYHNKQKNEPDDTVSFARSQITQKSRALYQLETMLT